ncbi:MAG: sensor histidine kinase/response regulator [Myxococcaceae bacterium]|nr:sensor histidine kinase/response regulator [Myxococcaceae bacterium]
MIEDPPASTTLSMSEIGSTLLAVAERAGIGLVITALGEGSVGPLLLSQAAIDIFGRPREELMSSNALDFLPEEERPKVAALVAHLLAQETTSQYLETVIVRPDGRRVPLEVTFVQVTHGDRVLTVNVLVDISARKELEDQLARTSRLAAMGTLAAGVAHEINNPLAFMALRAETLRRLVEGALPEGSQRAEALAALTDIETGVSRVASIIRGLQALTRDDDAEESTVDLRSVVASADQLVGREVRRRARVAIELADLPSVKVNAYRLEQVFANLLLNAAQAFNTADLRNLIEVRGGLDESSSIFVEVHDNGPGIPTAVLGRIFDPFFTSKPVGTGTGLGLSISQAILARLGGKLTVESTVGQGSTFRVVVPQSHQATPVPQPVRSSRAPGTRRGRILAVDDEPAIGESLRAILRSEWDVDVETSGAAALERIYGGGTYDIILCDLMMGDLTGVDVYERIATARPGLERTLVFMTGGAVTERARSFLARVPNQCLPKPFTVAELEQALAKAMDAEPA